MIALIFPRDDIDARSIAVSFAMENELLRVIPKGVFREWYEVARVLDVADAGMLIILNPYVQLDRATLRYIKYFTEQYKRVFVLCPNDFKYSNKIRKLQGVVVMEYAYSDINSAEDGLMQQVQRIWDSSSSDSDGIWETIRIVLLGVFAWYGIAFLLGRLRSK